MISPLVNRFAEMQRCTSTRAVYLSDLSDFERFCSSHGVAIGRATETVALDWRKQLEGRRLAPATIARKLTVARLFFEYLLDHRLRKDSSNPFRHVKAPRVDQLSGKTPCPSMADVQNLLREIGAAAPQRLRDRTIVLLLFNQGLRVSEVARIQRNQVGSVGGTTVITFTGKGSRILKTPLAPAVQHSFLEHLATNVQVGEYVFRMLRRDAPDRPLSTGNIRRLLKAYARRAGIDVRSIRPHSGRVFFITEAYRRTRDIERVARAIGHRNVATTRRYLRIQDDLAEHPARLVDLGDGASAGAA